MRWIGLLGHFGLIGVYVAVIGTLGVSIVGLLAIGIFA